MARSGAVVAVRHSGDMTMRNGIFASIGVVLYWRLRLRRPLRKAIRRRAPHQPPTSQGPGRALGRTRLEHGIETRSTGKERARPRNTRAASGERRATNLARLPSRLAWRRCRGAIAIGRPGYDVPLRNSSFGQSMAASAAGGSSTNSSTGGRGAGAGGFIEFHSTRLQVSSDISPAECGRESYNDGKDHIEPGLEEFSVLGKQESLHLEG